MPGRPALGWTISVSSPVPAAPACNPSIAPPRSLGLPGSYSYATAVSWGMLRTRGNGNPCDFAQRVGDRVARPSGAYDGALVGKMSARARLSCGYGYAWC